MKSFKVHILAADKTFYDGECESLIIPTSSGQYGILADHSNTITALVPGTLTYRKPGSSDEIAAVFSLYEKRVQWMDKSGVRQWNAVYAP